MRPTKPLGWPALSILLPIELWLAHALAFFLHEYSHTAVAWMLGWKASPFALHWPPFSALVALMQWGIDQGVDERPIFAGGHGPQAALIGAAGMLLGNAVLSMAIAAVLWRWASRRGVTATMLFAFLLAVASVGNLYDYVPLRVFAPGGDMRSLERGFRLSPWAVLVVLGVPILMLMVWFVAVWAPRAVRAMFGERPGQRALVAVVAVLFLFAFFGAAGWDDGGPAGARMSAISVYVLTPLLSAYAAWRLSRKSA